MAKRESDLIFEAYVQANEAVRSLKGFEDERCPVTGKLRKKSSDEEDDRMSSFLKLQKAKEEMPKIKEEEPKAKEEDNLVGGLAMKALPSTLGLAAAGGAAAAVGGHIAKKLLPKDKKAKEEDDLGLGPNTPSMVRITSIGSTTPFRKKTQAPIEDEAIFIQAGEQELPAGKHNFGYDGEIDMARAELLKANDYSAKLFDMVANAEQLPGWVASKITKAGDYLSSVFHYLDYEMNAPTIEEEEDDEKDFDPEDPRNQRSVELDSDKGTQTAMNTGFGGAQDDEDDVNEDLEQKYYEEGMKKGLRGQSLTQYVEDKMTQPGPHG